MPPSSIIRLVFVHVEVFTHELATPKPTPTHKILVEVSPRLASGVGPAQFAAFILGLKIKCCYGAMPQTHAIIDFAQTWWPCKKFLSKRSKFLT